MTKEFWVPFGTPFSVPLLWDGELIIRMIIVTQQYIYIYIYTYIYIYVLLRRYDAQGGDFLAEFMRFQDKQIQQKHTQQHIQTSSSTNKHKTHLANNTK